MKKKLFSILILVICLSLLTGCMCKHETWNEADCVTPKTCAECGETEGAPLGHVWIAATCDAPKTCETCGVTEGEAKGHSWVDATCTEAGSYDLVVYCSVCEAELSRETIEVPVTHAWDEGVYTDPTTEADGFTTFTCGACGETKVETDEGSKLPHGWVEEEGDIWYYYYKGKMTTDWLAYGPVWYYFNDDGVMRTGWLYYGGDYYYFDKAVTNFGRMVVNKWIQDGGKWYYFDANGYMVTGTRTIGGKTYNFDQSGICLNP